MRSIVAYKTQKVGLLHPKNEDSTSFLAWVQPQFLSFFTHSFIDLPQAGHAPNNFW